MKKTRRIEILFEILRIIFAMAIAYLLAMLVLLFISKEPIEAIKSFAFGPLTSKRRISSVFELMIPFMLTGTGMCMMYSANRFNLSVEGIFLFSGCIITLCSFYLNLPKVLFSLVLILIGAVVGGLLAFIPAVGREKLGANEVVISIMLNYALLYFSNFILRNFMLDTSVTYIASYPIKDAAKLTRLFKGTRLHTGLFVALLVVVLGYLFLYKTPIGLKIRSCGANASFAKYAGINVALYCIIAQVIGGACAGIGGTVQILGLFDRFQWDSLTQYGFDGLLVSVLAKRNPILVPVGAFLLAYLRIGADIVNYSTDVPAEFVSILQAIIILLVAAQEFLGVMKRKTIYKAARKEMMLEKGESK